MTPTRALLCVLASLCLVGGARAQVAAHHHLAFAIGDAEARVTVRVTGLSGPEITVGMPAWWPVFTPGIRSTRAPAGWKLRATSGQTPLAVKPLPPGSRWSVATGGATAITLRYAIPITGRKLATGLGQRNPFAIPRAGTEKTAAAKPASIRYHEAFVLRGGATWLDVHDATNRVSFDVPGGFAVATALPPATDGSYAAATYPELVASPMHVGRFEGSRFTVDGTPHRIVLSGFGHTRTDRGALAAMLGKLVRANQRAMGKLPYADYVFLIGRQRSQPTGVGHPRCTELVTPQLRTSPTLLRQLARSHLAAWDSPFFHPIAWSRSPIGGGLTEDAWFWLGAREYLTELAVVRAGFAKPDVFWTQTVAAKINRLQLDGRRLKATVAETGSRIRTPEGAIRPGAPHPRLVGFLLCLLLDVGIRTNTGGKMSLDTAVRGLAAQCAARRRGYTSGDIQEWCEKVGGRKFTDILACVRTLKELPLTATLAKIGVDARPGVRPSPRTPPNKRAPKPRRRPPRWRVTLPADAPDAMIQIRAAMTGGG